MLLPSVPSCSILCKAPREGTASRSLTNDVHLPEAKGIINPRLERVFPFEKPTVGYSVMKDGVCSNNSA